MTVICGMADWAVSLLAWDHNTSYQSRLLRALPRSCGRVLDVGCAVRGRSLPAWRSGLIAWMRWIPRLT
jgi:hypothetical protein